MDPLVLQTLARVARERGPDAQAYVMERLSEAHELADEGRIDFWFDVLAALLARDETAPARGYPAATDG